MAIIQAQLNEVDAWGGEIVQLPPGAYSFRIKEVATEQKESKDGKPYLQLVLDNEVISGEFSGKVQKSWFSCDFSKDTPRKRLKSLIVATGIRTTPSGDFDSNDLNGCQYNADVTHETYEGKPDPLNGGKTAPKTAVRIVNERPFEAVLGAKTGAANSGAKVGGAAMPGLTPG